MPNSTRASTHSLWVVLLAALMALGGSMAYDLFDAHEQTGRRERENLEHHAAIVERNLSQRLVSTDQTLDLVRSKISLTVPPKKTDANRNEFLREVIVGAEGIRTLTVVNVDGDIEASNRQELIGINLANQERYQKLLHATDPNMLYVTAPFTTPLGNYTIGLAKVMPDKNGHFGGYVMAIVDPEYFGTLLDSTLYAPDMRTSLAHGDGKIIYRKPDPEHAVGKDLSVQSSAFFVRHMQSGNHSDTYVGKTATTGEFRLATFRTIWPATGLADKPLVIMPSRTVDAVYASWRKDAAVKIGLYLILAAIAIGGLIAYQRRQSAASRQLSLFDAERKRLDEELRQSEERLRLLTDNLPDSAVYQYVREADGDGRFVYVSQGIESLNGVSVKEVLRDRQALHAQILPEYLEPLAQAEKRSSAGSSDFDMEVPMCRRDGQVRWMRLHSRPQRLPDGRTIWHGVQTDVTAQKRMERELLSAKAEAERSVLARSKFLAAASHDLRQPVQSLVLLLEVIKPLTSTGRAAKVVTMMETALDGLKGLLSSLLDISRVDAGVVVPKMESFDIDGLLHRLCDEYAPECGRKNLKLRRCCKLGLQTRTDAVLLERILRNLIENAIRFTDHGGLLIGTRRCGDRLRVDIVDSGIGIAADKLEQVFEEFYQVANPARDQRQGLGLGLSIVSRLARLIGAEVRVRSREGFGTRFTVVVPVAATPAPKSSPATAADLVSGLRVMVIEDEPTIRMGHQLVLEGWDCEVLSAASGEEALEIGELDGWRVDVIIADHRLGAGMSGTQTATEIANRAGRPIPTLIVTGDTATERIGEVHASGFEIMHKPVSPKELGRRMAQLLKGWEAGDGEQIAQ